jgi:hypothetical protein
VAQIGRHLSKRFLRRIKKRVVILSEAKDLLFAGEPLLKKREKWRTRRDHGYIISVRRVT